MSSKQPSYATWHTDSAREVRMPAPADRRYYPTLADAIDYQVKHKLLFRLVKSD